MKTFPAGKAPISISIGENIIIPGTESGCTGVQAAGCLSWWDSPPARRGIHTVAQSGNIGRLANRRPTPTGCSQTGKKGFQT